MFIGETSRNTKSAAKKMILAPLVASAYIMASQPAIAQENIEDLVQLSLKELMDIEVTSVSKKEEKAVDTAAAIYVITAEDIKNSGFTSVPETLRMVPGIQVSRIRSNVWAISSRGFALDFANKLLVLIDGRSVYNPLFSGVLWEEQSVPLENIERIEVIRGPGATLWGANAVNGVINIITKSAEDTQGTLLSAGAGNFEKATGLVRYGGKLDEETYYSAYAEYYDQGETKSAAGVDKNDDWDVGRTGFRIDSYVDDSTTLQVQGDAYKGERDDPTDLLPTSGGFPVLSPAFGANILLAPAQDNHNIHGANLIGKYSKVFEDDSELDAQAYYDFTHRDFNLLEYDIHTIDLDLQHYFDLNERNEIIWGLGSRFIHSDVSGSTSATGDTHFGFAANEREESIYIQSGFIQDKIELAEDELYLTLGSKFEYNTYTDFEVQPNIRLAYYPAENQTIWGSVSRAVRTPSITERTLTQLFAVLQAGPNTPVTVAGNDQYDSEEMVAYEVGYRFKPTTNSSLDLTAFYNDYDSLRTFEATGATTFALDNQASGRAVGFEAAGNYHYSEDLNFTASYSLLDVDLKLDSGSTDILSVAQEDKSPKHMFNIRSHYNITEDLVLNNAVYYVDELKGINVNEYLRFDANLIWQAADGIEVQLVGQNLLDDQHQEFEGATYNSTSEIPRSVYGKVTLRF